MFKRITSVALVAAMTATMFVATPEKKAQAAVTILTDKSIKLVVGEAELIGVLQKNAKFASSNQKVATVTKKGDVKAKKVGNCKITVTVGSSKKQVTVKVCPKTVKLKKVKVVGANSAESAAKIATIKANWEKVKGASGYEVYYSSKQKKGYEKITIKSGKKTSATIKKLPYGSTCFVKVKAYVKSGKKKISSASYSKILSAKTYSLAWSDEFNYKDKNKLKENWVYEVGHGPNNDGWGNDELQHYVPERNVSLDGKVLTIQPKYEKVSCGEIKREEYTSARMITRGKREYKYGKVEFRAKVPSAQGTWAALWMLGAQKVWPLCGEIDIMETMCEPKSRLFQLDRIPQTIHCAKFNGQSTSSGSKNGVTTVKGSTTDYHVYSIIWNEKVIHFYIDGKKTWTYNPDKYVLDGKGTSHSDIWPYNKKFYLLMNVAIGGTLGGIDKKDEIIGPKGQMKVDYVRVYQ